MQTYFDTNRFNACDINPIRRGISIELFAKLCYLVNFWLVYLAGTILVVVLWNKIKTH